MMASPEHTRIPVPWPRTTRRGLSASAGGTVSWPARAAAAGLVALTWGALLRPCRRA